MKPYSCLVLILFFIVILKIPNSKKERTRTIFGIPLSNIIKRLPYKGLHFKMALTGVAALEEWCRRALDGSGIEVSNMSSSWRDGMAFCALIQRYRPDLIDIDTLDPKDYRR